MKVKNMTVANLIIIPHGELNFRDIKSMSMKGKIGLQSM